MENTPNRVTVVNSISKQITVTSAVNDFVRVEWNDGGELCHIQGTHFGSFGMQAKEMELLYEALKELFNRV